jgi:hypothetical protein
MKTLTYRPGLRSFACGFLLLVLTDVAALAEPADSPSPAPTVETIVALRHGERHPDGLGQLSVRGLNRALALPPVLEAKFGKPGFVIVPDPKEQMTENGVPHCYVRPLMTLAPTAIHFQMPMMTPCGFTQIGELEKELEKPAYANAVVFLAWEHENLAKVVADLVRTHGGDPAEVPEWPGDDFDSLYVIKITRNTDGSSSVQFLRDREGLNGLSDNLPSPR